MLAAALEYADRGWPVVPCDPVGKWPRGEHGWKDATTDRSRIAGMRWGDASIGVATGWAFDVLDVDEHSASGWATLAGLGIALPETLAASTPSGMGKHFYFKPLGLGSRVLGTELEWNGAKGVVVPPAKGREWLNDLPIADAPDELIATVKRGKHKSIPSHIDGAGESDASDQRVLRAPNDGLSDETFEWHPTLNQHARFRAIIKWVEKAQPGSRNLTLFRAACAMAMMCVEGPLKPSSAMTVLMGAAWTNGLISKYGREACRRTIRSGFARVRDELRSGKLIIPDGLARLLDEVA